MAAFTTTLLRAGLMLSGLASDLLEDLPPDAYPGEETGAVVIEMITGTIRTAAGDGDRRELERATALIVTACDRVVEHLRLALEVRRRMEGEGDPGRPVHTAEWSAEACHGAPRLVLE